MEYVVQYVGKKVEKQHYNKPVIILRIMIKYKKKCKLAENFITLPNNPIT
jgi:hypothetical protein